MRGVITCAQLYAFVSFLLRRLPVYKQRIAGKSIPFEKFSIHKANKYLEQSNRLFLPGLVNIRYIVCAII